MAKLKGHAVIELRDVNTGKVERVEHDNLITNGAGEVLTAISELYTFTQTNAALLPIEEKLICGIYLFDDALTENANNTQLPDIADAKLTGYAGNATSDGYDNKRGDFNSAESEALVNGYKFVWDFGTDDANGTIASLALTNYVAGYHGYNIDFRMMINGEQAYTGNNRNNYKGIGAVAQYVNNLSTSNQLRHIVSYENDIVTTIEKVSTSIIEIKRYRLPFTTLKMKYKLNFLELIDSTQISYTDSNQNSSQTKFVDGGDGYYYGLYSESTTTTTNLSISKINKSTLEYTPATVTQIDTRRDGGSFYLPKIATLTSGSTGYNVNSAVSAGGFIYAYYGLNGYSGTGTYGIIKFPISNPANWTKVPNTEKYFNLNSNENIFLMVKNNGNIFTATCVIGSDGTAVSASSDFDPSQGSAYYGYSSAVTDGKNVILNRLQGSSSWNCYFLPLLSVLESINNLDTPVLKTASKTMKITYTLTEAT